MNDSIIQLFLIEVDEFEVVAYDFFSDNHFLLKLSFSFVLGDPVDGLVCF